MLQDGSLFELRSPGAVCVNALEKRGKLLLLGKRQFLRGMAFSLQFAIARMIPARIDGAGSPSLRPGPQGMSGAETEICKEPLTLEQHPATGRD